jgi:UDP-N-acetylglucosamine 2-epimerase (non-hydrolysing)
VKIVGVVGARPNFVKMAALMAEIRRHPDLDSRLIDTGQHYDASMAGRFFHDLELPPADVCLKVGSGSHAYQTAEVMQRLEGVLERLRPDIVVVVGDVNSTMAAALTAVKLGLPVAHVEAGLRSFDRSMPEEINRVVTDAIADELFASEESGRQNLLREGIDAERIHLVGNVMIDALDRFRSRWEASTIQGTFGLEAGGYGVVTLHRPSNVDAPEVLGAVMESLDDVARTLPLVFPVHPRTRQRLAEAGIEVGSPAGQGHGVRGVLYTEPLGYLDFMSLVANARVVLTDSGGLQEETTALGVPCVTLRDTTERPITVTHGTNRLVGVAPRRIVEEVRRVLHTPPAPSARPPLWDGRASERIVRILRQRGARGPAGSSRPGLQHGRERALAVHAGGAVVEGPSPAERSADP